MWKFSIMLHRFFNFNAHCNNCACNALQHNKYSYILKKATILQLWFAFHYETIWWSANQLWWKGELNCVVRHLLDLYHIFVNCWYGSDDVSSSSIVCSSATQLLIIIPILLFWTDCMQLNCSCHCCTVASSFTHKYFMRSSASLLSRAIQYDWFHAKSDWTFQIKYPFNQFM